MFCAQLCMFPYIRSVGYGTVIAISFFTWYALNELFELSLDTTPPPKKKKKKSTHTHELFTPTPEACACPLLSDSVETCSCLLSSLLETRSGISNTQAGGTHVAKANVCHLFHAEMYVWAGEEVHSLKKPARSKQGRLCLECTGMQAGIDGGKLRVPFFFDI